MLLTSPFAPDWAYQNLGGYAQGFANSVMGTAQFGYNVAATATYGLISPVAPNFAYNNYGGSVQQLMGQAPAFYGGNNQPLAYQIGYGAVNAATMLLGGEEAEVGNLAKVGELTDVGVQTARAAEETAAGGGRVFYGTPQGQLIEAPPGYQAVTAQNGNGLVLLPEGQTLGNNSSIIRWGEPSASNPDGYFRYYNSEGQPLNPATGQPGPNSATHIPPNYQGPLNGYPGR